MSTEATPAGAVDAQGAQERILDEYMSDAELADELGVSPRTIARWDRLREGPPITRVGRKKFRRREAVRAWLAARETEAT